MKKFFVLMTMILFAGVMMGCESEEKNSSSSKPNMLKITSAEITTEATDSILSVSPSLVRDTVSSGDSSATTAESTSVYAEYVTWETWCYNEWYQTGLPEREHYTDVVDWDAKIAIPCTSEHTSYKSYSDVTPVTGTVVTNASIKGLANTIFGRQTLTTAYDKTLPDGSVLIVPAGTEVYQGMPCWSEIENGESVNGTIRIAIRSTIHMSDGTSIKEINFISIPLFENLAAWYRGDTSKAVLWGKLYPFFLLPVGSDYVKDIALVLTAEIDPSLVKP